MIPFFPEFYPDELFYSTVARFSVYGGIKDELLLHTKQKPNINLINELNPQVAEILSRYIPFEKIITDHTMIPCLIRFMPLYKRVKIYNSILENKGSSNDIFTPLNEQHTVYTRELKYCPMCIKEDRKKYGEAYWHREHQITGMNMCVQHKCYLLPFKNDFKTFITLEQAAKYPVAECCHDEFIVKYSQYLSYVFYQPLDMSNHLNIRSCLARNLGMGYFYDCERKFIIKRSLCDDLYWHNFEHLSNNFDINSIYDRIINQSKKFRFDEFCFTMAVFSVPFDEVSKCLSGYGDSRVETFYELPETSILGLFKKGNSFPVISKKLNLPVWLVATFLREIYGCKIYEMLYAKNFPNAN